jgi:cysteine desulfurase/selenocysteine lyase
MTSLAPKTDFPVLIRQPHLVYLDTAASALTPTPVIDALLRYYRDYPANVARGLYDLSSQATQAYEHARATVASFIGAHPDEIIFTSGATLSLNMIAAGLAHITPDDTTVITTLMDHHANIVPWQEHFPGRVRYASLTDDGHIDMSALLAQIDTSTRIVTLPLMSNVLGTHTDINTLSAQIRAQDDTIMIVIDASQAAPHIPLSTQDLDCDFLAFSGHKLYGPTGIGVLYGRRERLATLPPFVTGGEMVARVTTSGTTFKELPHGREAGTPPIAQAIGLGAAVTYIDTIGMDDIVAHDRALTTYAIAALTETFGTDVTIYGPQSPKERSGLLSLTIDGTHPHDLAHILNDHHVAIRAGSHCAQPLHACIGTSSTARASWGVHTTTDDIDRLVAALMSAQKTLSPKK